VASTVIAFRLTPVLYGSGLSRGATGGFDAGGRHATEGAGQPLDIAGQSDKLMDLFLIGFAVRCSEECLVFCRPTWRLTSARQTPSSTWLAAILAADVVGYSRLIEVDEVGTLDAFKTIRAELFDPTIAGHHGRLVKTTGDGLLVEFSSVVDALRCAIEVQSGMAERNATIPTDSRIEFRIAIHQGDVVVEDGDIFGDGVNIAARLEGLAQPGGICVSARVQEDAAGRLDLSFEDMGEQQLKNIARPVRKTLSYFSAASAFRPSPQRIFFVPSWIKSLKTAI
jgi:class 3 adenylate cyclase